MANRYQADQYEDARLPSGMRHVGYDADEQTHQYRDRDGSYWEPEPGARYGVLHRSGTARNTATAEEAALTEQEMRRHEREAWQYLLPLLLPLAVLIYFFNFLGPNSSSSPDSHIGAHCGELHAASYLTKSGDSCWAIADERGGTIDDLIKLNPDLDCGVLKVGQIICVPSTEE